MLWCSTRVHPWVLAVPAYVNDIEVANQAFADECTIFRGKHAIKDRALSSIFYTVQLS